MKNTTRVLALLAGGLLVAGSTVDAQSLPADYFVNVNVGLQVHSHEFSSRDEFPIYDETGTVISSQSVGNGFLFDVSGAYRVWNSVAFGVGLSTFGDSGDASMTATIPHPLFFSAPRTVTAVAENLSRRETAIHLQAIFFLLTPDFMPDDARIALVIGPSIFHLRQELIASVSVPTGTQNALPVVENQSKTGVGFNGGFDLTYPIDQRYGIGGFVRYAGGQVDLDSAADVKVGGFQAGVGLRIGF